MTTHTTLESLRHDFDAAFQRPREVVVEVREALLVVRAGPHELAVVLSGVGELVRRPRVTPVPLGAASPALAGLGTWHGELVAMFDLATLLGAARDADAANTGAAWAVFGRGGEVGAVGFVFDALLAHVDVAPGDIAGAGVARVVRIGGRARTLMTMAELVELAHPTQVTAPAARSEEETAT